MRFASALVTFLLYSTSCIV